MPIETRRALTLVCLCATAMGLAAPALAQSPTERDTVSSFSELPDLNGDQVDRQRLGQILGRDSIRDMLIRSPSALAGELPGNARFRFKPLAPFLQITANSGSTFSLNDGLLWAGRGFNALLRAGWRASWGAGWLTVAPELVYSGNIGFRGPDLPGRSHPIPPGRKLFSSPWHTIPLSADLPVRFGDRSFWRFEAGQTALGVNRGAFSVGIANENLWWGPGIRNAIVMSNNAPGFPHLFIRSSRPLTTAIGAWEGSWIVGGLSESPFFDYDPSNNLRSLAGVALAWRPRWVPALQLGATRTVFAPASGWGALPLRLFNVFAPVGRPNSRPLSDSTMIPGRDQIYSIFFRYVLPNDGVEAYAEWSRTEFPVSVRDFLIAPTHTQGYTLGLQWARPLASALATLRVQAEATYLEQSATFRDRPLGTYYTSRAVVQGYTQRGQIIGASIGPGASSQWLAIDYLRDRWRVGIVGGRIRWEDDALYALPWSPLGDAYCSHDVSIWTGLRGAYRGSYGHAEVSLLAGRRLNPFFVHVLTGCDIGDLPAARVDVTNATLELRLVPSW